MMLDYEKTCRGFLYRLYMRIGCIHNVVDYVRDVTEIEHAQMRMLHMNRLPRRVLVCRNCFKVILVE